MGVPYVEVSSHTRTCMHTLSVSALHCTHVYVVLPYVYSIIYAIIVSKAPCEAEAQCAALVKADLVYATATEDMDSLTYGSSVVLRHLTASEAK